MIGFITDGVKCVLKHELCEGALDQSACTKNKKGELFDWVTNLDPTHCVLRTCQTTLSDLKTEIQCQNYLQGCTQIYGGCKQQLLCSHLIIKEACTKSNSGEKCSWNDNQCRNFDCQDLSGGTHQSCRNNQVIVLQDCLENVQECRIVNKHSYKMLVGSCFQYSSCNSISLTIDEQCKQISPFCTTNGQSCVSISNCSQNSQQGCKIGYDGDCILLDNICKKFDNCQEAKYLTHVECQTASRNCTSEGISSCIQLAQCQNYLAIVMCNRYLGKNCKRLADYFNGKLYLE